MIKDIPCVILSGGKSSRMGEDKSLLPFGDFDTLIEYQYQKLSKIFSNVYISTKVNKFNFDADLILDTNLNISSPMVALKSILEYLKEDKVFIITVDTPFIQKQTIQTLINNSNLDDIVIASDGKKVHNLCGIFKKILLSKIYFLLENNNHKINDLLHSNNSKIISFKSIDQFININTSNDYYKATLLYKNY